jgi:heme a synthase
MPFDPPTSARIVPSRAAGQRAVGVWLLVLCAMILVMVTLGGATRLTGSGLSIMEWAPIMGVVPPLSDAEWHRLYDLYRQIPQYRLVNQGFGIDGFKGIFWLEWVHRFWGRAMGVAFAVPLAWFLLRGRIGWRLGARLGLLLVLGGLQGAVGWVMVASGFEADRTAVSPYRLVAHLSLAVLLYAAMLWTALDVLRPAGERTGRRLRIWAGAVAGLVALTMLAGGFVAGLKAGLTYNSFPFMDGRLVPSGYAAMRPFLLNWFENVAAVQFNHRVLATVTALAATGLAIAGTLRGHGLLRAASIALGLLVLTQYALGVTTLLWAVPLPLGVAHQAVAMLLLTAALVALHAARGRR